MPQQIRMSVLTQSKIPVRQLPNPYTPKYLPNASSLNAPMISRVGSYGFGHPVGCSSCGRKG